VGVKPVSANCSSIPVITNVDKIGLQLEAMAGFVVSLEGDVPPGRGRDPSHGSRLGFWFSGEYLQTGCLVALISKKQGHKATVQVGTVTTCE
jgi:hypothetical protein